MLRFIHHGRGDPAWNMAVDEALLRHCSVPVLRVYRWTIPAVSIGYFQSHAVAPKDRPLIRRLTGGGLVDHADDMTYTIVLPQGHPLVTAGTATSYRLIHEAIARALKGRNVDCALAADCPGGAATACFQKPVRFDVVAPDGSKLAGAAQRRSRHGVLHQGSILVPNLPGRFAEALLQEVADIFGNDARPDDLSPDEHATATNLAINRYGTDDWNRRR